MGVEYDLVIIGNTDEALFAAREASKFPCRIALVLSNPTEEVWRKRHIYQFSTHLEGDLERELLFVEQEMLTILATRGVDIIEGQGEFVRLPSLGLVVGERKLRSRAYLLATGSHPTIPEIEGLDQTNYLTTVSLWLNRDWDKLSEEITVIGDSINTIEIAQLLQHRGKQINLVTANLDIVPEADQEISRFLQAILEADGLGIFNNSAVTQIKIIEGKCWIQAGNQAIETQQLLVTPLGKPNIAGLNLANVGVNFLGDKLKVNSYLQTDNPRIYACGELITLEPSRDIAEYQAKIAVQNALSWRRFTSDPQNIPRVIFTQPPLARVGLSEAKARNLYGEKIDILRNHYHNLDLAQIEDQTKGLVKVIVQNNGRILGIDVVGTAAGEIIGAMAIAKEAKLNLSQLMFRFPHGTLAEILQQISLDCSEKTAKKTKESSFLKTLSTWRRSWLN